MAAVSVFAAVTVLMWGTRINNILADESASGVDRAVDIAVAVVLVALGVAVGLAALGGRGVVPAVGALAAATVAVWAVRVPLILAHDHPLGFDLVHLGLAAGSVALAALAWRAVTRRARVAAAR